MRRWGGFLRLSRGFCLVALLLACGCSLNGKTSSKPAAGDSLEDQILFVNRNLIELEKNTEARARITDGWLNQLQNSVTDLQRQVELLLAKTGLSPSATEPSGKVELPAFSPTTELPPTTPPETPTQPATAEPPTGGRPAAAEPVAAGPKTTEPAAGQPGATTPAATEPTPPVAPAMSDPDKAEAQLLKLRACKSEEVVDVVKKMKPLSKYLVKPLIDGLNDPDYEFRPRAERALAQLDPVAVMADVVAALENPRTRIQAVRIIGALGATTKEVIERLLGYLAKPDNADLAFDCANTLALLRVKDAVPKLISYLRSDDEIRRLLAFHTLSKVTGQSFDYGFKAAQEVREESVRKWEVWWDENKEKLWNE